jgi:hypothetical protein
MIRDTWTAHVPWPQGKSVFIVKVTKGTILDPWQVRRVINALRRKLPSEQIGTEVVVMDGEPLEQPNFMNGTSPEAEAYVRSILPKIETLSWSLTKLDW